MSTRQVDYKRLQQRIYKVLSTNMQAIPCTIRAYDGSQTITSILVFDNGEVLNIDNRQNPTPIYSLGKQYAYIPGTAQFTGGYQLDPLDIVTAAGEVYQIESVNVVMPTTVVLLYQVTLVKP